MRFYSVLSLLTLLALPVLAQNNDDDDELVPLLKTAKPKAKPKPRAKPFVAKPVKPKKTMGVAEDLTPLNSKGSVLVKTSLSRAMLLIDNKEVGLLPLPAQTLSVGDHQISVKRAGYALYVKTINIAFNKALEIEAKLVAINAVLSVTSDVVDAQVLVNGRTIGTAPITDFELPAGPIELSLLKPGFEEEIRKLILVAGKDYPIRVEFGGKVVRNDAPLQAKLSPKLGEEPAGGLAGTAARGEPITSKWYFWVGIGAAVAAATVATVVIVNNQSPISRKQEEVCPSPCTWIPQKLSLPEP
jgi:hypothetical protein